MKPMNAPADDAGDHAEDRSEDAEAARRVRDPGAEHGAEDQLALATDVEQTHPQRQHDGQPGEHERRGLLQGAGQAVRHEERLPDQRLVRVQQGRRPAAGSARAPTSQGDDESHHDDHTALVGEHERERLAVGSPLVRRPRAGRRSGGLFGHRGCLGHVTPMSVGAHSVACRGPGQEVRHGPRADAPGAGTRWVPAPVSIRRWSRVRATRGHAVRG